MAKDNLQKILDARKKWLNDEIDDVIADLRDANLSDADLRGADLRDADLSDANLPDADLSHANIDTNIFCIDRIGSQKRRTTYDATHDIVWCGCFKGTFNEWCAKINETYPDKTSRYRREYDAAVEYLSKLAKIATESEVRNGNA